MDAEWITIDELLTRHHGRISRWSLNEWARQGRFGEDVSKLGRKRWFRADAVERLLAREAKG